MDNLSIYIASDTTVDYLGKFISKNTRSNIEVEIAPYNQISNICLSEPEAKVLLIWSCPDMQISSYKKLINFENVNYMEIEKEVQLYSSLIKKASEKYDSVFMLSWAFPPDQKWPIGLTYKNKKGCIDVLMRMNLHLTELLSECKNFHLLDSGILQSNFSGK